MNNIWLIIKREYMSRVMKKSFIIMTFLAPLIFVGVFALIGYLSSKGGDSKTIEILDESALFSDTFKSDLTNDEIYEYVNISLDSAKNRVSTKVIDGLVYIPKMNNLADDPQYAAVKADLKNQLTSWMTAQGDLGQATELAALEHQKRGQKKANKKFWWSVLRFFRPSIISRNNHKLKILNTMMLSNYFKITTRTMMKSKLIHHLK